MNIFFNWLMAFAACVALLLFWSNFRTSGRRGLVVTLAGCVVILAAALAINQPARFLSGAGVLVAIGLVVALLVLASMVMRSRRRASPRYKTSDTVDGRCAQCSRASNVKRTKYGWLCGNCRVDAMVAGKL